MKDFIFLNICIWHMLLLRKVNLVKLHMFTTAFNDFLFGHVLFIPYNAPVLWSLRCFCFIQFARKFYIAQWYRDTTVEVEKAMKSQNDDDDPKYRRHSMDSDATGEIVQTVEARKKFLRKIIKTTPSNFSSVK